MIAHFVRGMVLLGVFVSLYPATITEKQAAQVALNWTRQENAKSTEVARRAPIQLSRLRDFLHGTQRVGFVADFSPIGFAIIPAISELPPIKFVCFSAHYAELEHHPFIVNVARSLSKGLTAFGYYTPSGEDKDFLSKESADVHQLRGTNHPNSYRMEWASLLRSSFTPLTVVSSPILLTSRWNQDYPYNLRTPIIDGKRTFTGCLPTALAQILYYWRYPAAGRGVHTYSFGDADNRVHVDLNHAYRWDLMLDRYDGDETAAQMDAVAELMSDIGLVFGTSYGHEWGSPTWWTDHSSNNVVSHWGYSGEMRDRLRAGADFPPEVWSGVVKEQIDKGWPILAGGGDHAYVVDGYRTEASMFQFHANFGWGGANDNYYTIDEWDYSPHTFTINIHPPTEDETETVNGRVTDQRGNGIEHVEVAFFDWPNEAHLQASAWTDVDGFYQAHMPQGKYWVKFDAQETDFASVCFSGKDCGPHNGRLTADAVVVGGEGVTQDVNATLLPGSVIAGTLTCPYGPEKSLPYVFAYRVDDAPLDHYFAADYIRWTDGGFEIRVQPGTYYVMFNPTYNSGEYNTEYFNNRSSADSADLVHLSPGQRATINAEFDRTAVVSGHVTDSDGKPLVNALITFFTPRGEYYKPQWTNSQGNYRVALKEGEYKVQFESWDEFHEKRFYGGAKTIAEAETIRLEVGESRSGIDAELPLGGSIRGRITDAAGTPLNGFVEVYTMDHQSLGWTMQHPLTASYLITHLAPGDYRLRFYMNSLSDWTQPWYKDKLAFESADLVRVNPGAVTELTAVTMTHQGSTHPYIRFDGGPASQTVVKGRTAQLTVVPQGTPPFRFQWYLGESGDFRQPAVGAWGSTYTPTINHPSKYWAFVENDWGSCNSKTAFVDVRDTPECPANLALITEAGSPGPVAVTAQPGYSSRLTVTDPLLLSWVVMNDGDLSCTVPTIVTARLDGNPIMQWNVPALLAGQRLYVSHFPLGRLTPGYHSIRLSLDEANQLIEGNEGDNDYTLSFAVRSPRSKPRPASQRDRKRLPSP